MRRYFFTAAASLFFAASAMGEKLSDETILRFAPMPEAPVIDGKITPEEWKFASTTFGGISPKTRLMTFRQNDFRIGYDAKNIYVAITSETPPPPQPMNSGDQVEFQFIPPGKTTPLIVKFDSTGKGKIPAGVKIANGFSFSPMNSEKTICWNAEAVIPLSVLGVKSIEDGKKWKFQMIRHWASQSETGYFHLPAKEGDMATFIPDKKALTVSFDGFGHNLYAATGNYTWIYRIETTLKHRVYVHSKSFRAGLDGAATLDINNPDLIGKSRKVRIGSSTRTIPGKTSYFQLYMMAQFPGKPRCLYSQIFDDAKPRQVLYQRTMFWDTNISRKAASFKDDSGYPFLNAAFYPSYGNKFRFAATFNKKLPIGYAEVKVKDTNGKVYYTFKKSSSGKALKDFEEQTALPNLPLGDYVVSLDTIALDGRKFFHKRTFSIRKFEWQGLDLGKERVIVPPFKPLKHNADAKEVHALLTGYKIGDGIWSKIYAEGENILAAPIQLFLDGKAVKTGKIKLVSAEKDRIVYELTSQVGRVKFQINQDYDYDGFCKLTVKVIPLGKVKVKSFELRIPLKNDLVKYYTSLRSSRKRSLGRPDWTIPAGQGELKLDAILRKKGRIEHYFWLGEEYKGLSWIIDTQRGFTVDKKTYPCKLIRKGNTITYVQQMVNVPAEWSKPWEFEMGFSPTPVKRQNKQFRTLSQWMYHYPVAKGSNNGGSMLVSQWPLLYFYNINELPQGDDSYYRKLMETRGKTVSNEERIKFGEAYIARHRDWIRKNRPLVEMSVFRRQVLDRRNFGLDYYLQYHNPAFYSYRWPEAEMYKAEWLPWDYPVDDAHNEYIAAQSSTYIDKMLWEILTQIRWGMDGMNFDCFALGGGHNSVSMKGFRDAPGRVPMVTNSNMLQIASPGYIPATNLFGWRELLKRTAHLLYTEKRLVFGVPWVELHSTNIQAVPVAAFCSTVITTECASGGNDYFDRFPRAAVLADIAGLQSGVVPRNIISTKSTKLSPEEQMRTMMGLCFAYGLMNHFDQGIMKGYTDYGTARDAIFSFGYGRPENQTIAFYDKETQPVTCNAKNIRTTQVIRPDGMALILVGNIGENVKAKFDLSGLNYGKYKITDVFTGKVLPTAEIEVQRHGYALLKIEKL